MKYIYSIGLLCLISCFWVTNSNAQAPNCFDAYLSPFCSGIAQYPANFDGTGAGSGPQAPPGPNYDCLGTQGNPSYFSLTIQQTGNISFTLDNTANVDIDFILWGPFSSLTAASSACDSMGNGNQWGGVADCSYLGASQELVEITNAQAGEIYILMVTNFANVATNIFSTQNTGTGDIACPCDIPYTIDTMTAATGNQGYLTDTVNGINQFVVCPNNTLGIQVGAQAALNDTLSLYGPFTTVNNVFANNTVVPFSPNLPSRDSLVIFTLVTPTTSEIGVHNFNIGMRNDVYTGGFSDSSCFDLLDVQVVVPGVQLSDRDVCSGETFEIIADSIPITTLGGSNYAWRQVHGPTVSFSSTSSRTPSVTIPTTSSTSSNDSVIIVVDYDYAGMCPMSDTMVLRFKDVNITVSATPDSVCVGETSDLLVVLSDTLTPSVCNDYNVTTIPFATVAGTGTVVPGGFGPTLGDDDLSPSLPIGFNFNFFCNNYTNFFVSSNGFITFDPNSGNGCCSGQTIPDAAPFNPNDLIAMCWTDCNPTNGGTIEYFTVGTAPNRQLIVNFTNVPPFTANSGNQTVQAILFETTNVIELHVTNATPSGTFNTLSLGIENVDGTLGHAAPGANSTNTTISNVAFRFEPKNFGPFYTWSPAASLNASDIPDPIATLSATTTYTVTVEDGVCSYIDTTLVYAISGLAMPTVMCDSSTINSISFSWSNLSLPPTGFYEYSLDGGTTWINAGTALSTTVTSLLSNTFYTIQVRANDGTGGLCPLSPIGTTTCSTLNPDCISNPAINIVLTPANLLCNNDSSGCISAIVTGGSGNPMNLTWSNDTMDIDSICNLTAGTYTLVVTDTFSTGAGGPSTDSTLYNEAFDGTHNWTLNVSTGTNGADNNFWVVNSNEAGQAVGACGAAGGTNQSLHITSVFNPNGGAAYDAGGFCGTLFCPETNMRAESPTFSTLGQSNLTFEFNYIANGSGLIDNASVWYNDGNGWQQLDPSIKSPLCSGGQGQWSRFSMALPASCENKPSVQVGINWSNNDDGAGTDPSVAIDSVLVFSTSVNFVSCLDSQTVTITEPPVLVITIDSFSNPSCNGLNDGTVSTTTTGGTANYNYNWSNTAAVVADVTGLNSGIVTVTVTDANGCTDTTQTTLVDPSPIIIVVDSITNNSCAGTADGAIYITASGGAGSLGYSWNSTVNTEDFIGVSNGTYTVTVTDANGCTDTTQATVIPTVSLTVANTVVNPLCNGDNGTATLTVTGGSGTYQYNWGAASTATINTASVAAGTFIVTITDNGNGCTTTNSVTLTAPAVLSVTLLDTTNIGCTDAPNSGAIDIQVTGGTTPYSFVWNNGPTPNNEDLTGLAGGSYSVVVTDDNNCTVNGGPYTVEQAIGVTVNINTLIGNLACDLQPIGSLQATGTGGSNITYVWSDASGTTNSTIANLAAGTYTVTATNNDGCTNTASQTINAPVIPTVNAFVSVTGMTSVSIPLNSAVPISAGTTGFSYNWTNTADPVTGNANIANPAAATTTTSPDPEGNYTYIVTASATTNDTTCIATDTVWVTVEAPFQGIPTAFTPDGDGINDTFRPVMLTDQEIKTFRIYNRWGQEVYNGDQSHANGWDGTFKGVPQPTEVYIYFIEYKKASDPEPTTSKGEFTLIR